MSVAVGELSSGRSKDCLNRGMQSSMAQQLLGPRFLLFVGAVLIVTQLCWIVLSVGGLKEMAQSVSFLLPDAAADDRPERSLSSGLTRGRTIGSHVNSTHGVRPPCVESPSKCEVMHLTVLSCGPSDARNIALLIKSIVIHRSLPVHFHLFVDRLSFVTLAELMRTWRLPEVRHSLYALENITVTVNSATYIASRSPYLLKLALPEVLPPNVRQIIVFSGRIVVNADLSELWSLFRLFKETEGVALIRTPSRAEVLLMHLENLRRADWSSLWRVAREQLLLTVTENRLGSQIITDAVLRQASELQVPLPCQWGGEASTAGGRCPLTKRRPKILSYDEDRLPARYWKDYVAILNYDGALLRDFTGNCFSKEVVAGEVDSGEEQRQLTDLYSSPVCKEYFQELIFAYRTHPFLLEYAPSSSGKNVVDVAIATQLSFDRITMLERLILRWPGPISAALYVSDSDIRHLLVYVLKSKAFSGRRNVGVHLVFNEGSLYPTNHLRNVALRYADTSHVFLLDIDFMPPPGLYSVLRKTIVTRKIDEQKLAIVVPAFETDGPSLKLPDSKDKFLPLLNSGVVYPFRNKVYSVGHGPTDFAKWSSADRPYMVRWRPGYEPYIVMRTDAVPPYSELFSGYGMNKIEHILEVTAMGYKLLVLSDGFIVHFPHSAGFEKVRVKASIDIQRCKRMIAEDFARDVLLTYGSQSLGGWRPRPRNVTTA